MKNSKIRRNLDYRFIHLIIYILYVVLANCLGLFSLDIMKWDIMDGTYPNALFLSNALKDGVLPLWNPLFSYGLPHYANVGMPVYYPTTIIFGFFGYRLWMVTAEYAVHLLIACYGMNRYIAFSLREKENQFSSQLVMLFTGLLYGFSGLFLSNAQHIMIIISAAWLPWIFGCIRKYYVLGKKKYLVYAAAFTGLSVQGGYPELWVGMVLIIIPYMILHITKKSVFECIKQFAVNYLIYGLLVLLASAITVLPTLVLMPFMQRLNGSATVTVSSYDWKLFLSAIVPKWASFVNGLKIDISMVCAYVGIFTLILIPLVVINKWNKEKGVLIGICIYSILMMFGDHTPLLPFFQKFIPMFSSFRFPTTYRCFLALFLLELTAEVWSDILEGRKAVLKKFIVVLVMADVAMIGLQIIFKEAMIRGKLLQQEELFPYCNIVFGFITCMLIIVGLIYFERLQKLKGQILITILIFIEVITIFRIEYPFTIGRVKTNGEFITNIQNISNKIEIMEEENISRNHCVDYKNAVRGNGWDNLLNSTKIVLTEELSEVGYTQVKLDNILNYRKTANRYIIQSNPVFYLSNDVVTKDEIELEQWLNDWSIDNRQIWLDEKDCKIIEKETEPIKELKNGEFSYSEYLDVIWNGDCASVCLEDVEWCQSSKNNAKWKMYVSDDSVIGEEIQLTFYAKDGESNTINYIISNLYEDSDGIYIYGSFPTYDEYIQIDFKFLNADKPVVAFEYIEHENEKVEENIEVLEFGPNRIRLNTVEEKDAYLVTLQTDYPGWKAYIDGKEEKIVKVNGVFRGIYVEAGEHEIEFRFIPIDFYVGLFITSIFYLIVLGYILNEVRILVSIKK